MASERVVVQRQLLLLPASAATAWAPSIEERSEEVGVMVYHHWSSKPFCASSQGTLVAC